MVKNLVIIALIAVCTTSVVVIHQQKVASQQRDVNDLVRSLKDYEKTITMYLAASAK